MSGKRTVGLSAWLAFLVLGAVAPLLLFAGATLFQFAKDARAARDQGQGDTARALALAVDGEVRSWKAAVTALAASRSLQRGQLAEFYEEARQVAAPHDGWILLIDANGQQILNTLRPYGIPLPKTGSPDTIRAIFKDGKPIVTDLAFGNVVQRLAVSVVVPVLRNGQIIYALSMTFGPERLSRLLERQQLPASWVAGITDRQHRVVARSRDAETRVGKPLPEWFAAALGAANSGIVNGPLTDNRPVRVAFHRLQEVPWVVALAVPTSEIPWAKPLIIFLLFGIGVSVIAAVAAVYSGRRITTPIYRLAEATEPILQGEAVDLGALSSIREVRELQRALVEASGAVQASSHERERAAVAVETAKVATAAEQALRESEGRLQLFIENAPAAIAMFDRDLRYLAVSRRWRTDYGLGDRNILGHSHYEVFPEIPDAWKTAHQQGLAGEVVQATEDRFVRRDGTVQWLRWEVRPWHRGDGTLGGIILFTEDITDRKRAEEEIQSLAKFPDENPAPIVRTTADGTILYANPASRPLLEAWATGTGKMLPQPWRDTVQQVHTSGSPREIEVVSGDRVLSLSLVPIRGEGYVNLYGRDMTERKQAEHSLRQAHDELERKIGARTAELSDAVARLQGEVFQRQQTEARLQRTNQVLRMLSACNEALVRMDDEHKLMQEICRIAVDIGGYRMAWVGLAEDDAERSVRPVASTGFAAGYLEAARISWADTERGRGPTGTAIRLGQVQIGTDFLTEPRLAPWRAEAIKRGFRSSISLPLREGAAVVGALTIYAAEPNAFQDAEVKVLSDLAEDLTYGTTALRMRTALRDSRDRLRALAGELTLAEQRERRRVAEVLHGDLQQLLVGAKLLVSPLAQAIDPAVREACREATELIGQAIASSRSLTEELSPPILHRGDLVSPLAWLVRWMGEKHNLAVVVRASGPVRVESQDTAALVFQAIRELLFNAVKHAHVETAQVELTRSDDQLQIVVADAGVGFDPTQLRGAGGTAGGFGLFGIRERLELLGGRMEIESAPGKGSQVTLWVPLQRAMAGPSDATAASGRADRSPRAIITADAALPGSGPRKIRVLLVDDHRVMRQGLARLLQEEPDIEIVGEASDGQMAVTSTRQLMPDVVAMDIDMAGMDGIEATRRICAECPAVQVIGLSMFERAEQAAAMGEAGAVTYLTKGGPLEALVAAIRACRPGRRIPG